MENDEKNTNEEFDSLLKMIKKLRCEGGCAWDIAQSPSSLKEFLLEETYELIDAIENYYKGSPASYVKIEIGDLILNLLMLANMYDELHLFNIRDVFYAIKEKLIRRIPHILGNTKKDLSKDEVMLQWEQIKEKENVEQDTTHSLAKDSILDDIPFFPPLIKTLKLKNRVAKVGFDWNNAEGVIEKLDEEITELKTAIKNNDNKNIEEELGDVFFVLVNLADKLGMNSELTLNMANKKFEKRFRYVEKKMKESGFELQKENIKKMNEYWEEAKKTEGL